MSYKTNYHTHTTFCDGKNTAEEMVKAAIEKNFDALGFSSHSMYPFAGDWHIAPREHQTYVNEIRHLQDKYNSKIDILCGFEADYIPSMCAPDFNNYAQLKPDYLIGSVHYIVTDRGHFTVDESPEGVKRGIENCFSGNGKKAVQEYFYLEREMLRNCDFTIIGHADLIRLRNGKINFFDPSESWYKHEVKQLVKEIARTNVIVEVNSGAISRGLMDDVYPAAYMLDLLKEKNVPVTISSDAHVTANLDGAFDRACEAIKKAGYSERAVLIRPDSSNPKGSFTMMPLDK